MSSASIRTKLSCFMLTALLSAPTAALTQDITLVNHNAKSARGLAKTYGFLIGQQMTLEDIERRHPELKSEALVARLTFEAAFPRLLPNLEAELRSIFGADKLRGLRDQMLGQLEAIRQPVDSKRGSEFLKQVHGRAKGEGIEPEILAYLLAIRYARQPVGEFTDGFRQRFQTDGIGKAQGLRLTLQLPRSWQAQEGERPHVVKKWMSEAGTGLSMITLDIRDTGGVTLTAADIADLVKSGEIRQMFSSIGTVSDASSFSIERQPGIFIRLSLPQERLGLRLFSEGAVYQVFFRGKAVGITCMASRPEPDRVGAADAWKRLDPLCRQIANSLVLSQVY